jgi:hypothetical protein
VYCTIFALEESRTEPGVLWAGSDDGLVHVTRNGGTSWENVTPKQMPQWGTVNTIDLSAKYPGRALIAVHRYRLDDFKPYIFRTDDYGKTWQLLTDGTNGIPPKHFVRVAREDPDRKGLLYAGTEFGMYVSFDDGKHWQSFQLNFPVTPVTDLKVHQKDLVLSTQGRSFWILDDLTPLHQLSETVARAGAHLFQPRAAYRVRTSEEEDGGLGTAPRDLIGGVRVDRERIGTDAPDGAIIYSYFAEEPKEEVTLEILDRKGAVVRKFSSQDDPKDRSVLARPYPPSMKEESTFHEAGLNRFIWDLRYSGPLMAEGGKLTSHNTLGPVAPPGTYQVRLTRGGWTATQSFEILKDPRIETTQEEFEAQLALEIAVRDQITELQRTVLGIRDLREQVSALARRLAQTKRGAEIERAAKTMADKLAEIETQLVPTADDYKMARLDQPPKLNAEFFELYDYIGTTGGLWRADARPTEGAYRRFEDLKPELAERASQLKEIIDLDLAAFNKMIREAGIPSVIVPGR